MRLIRNIFLRLRRIVDVLSALLHISSDGGGHHLPPDPVIAIYPPLILALVHKWQLLSDGRLLLDIVWLPLDRP